MQVHYYEASALCDPGHAPGQPVTLEDYHRTAWQLFTGDTHYPKRERPFIFRVEWLTQERHFFTVRAAGEFPHAEKHHVSLHQGATLTLDWHWVPTVATRLSSTGERLTRSQHIPAPRERWANLITERMQRQGLNVDTQTLSFCPLGEWQHRRNQPQLQRVIWVSAQVSVIDEAAAAQAWLNGVSRLRAYGMGMLCKR
ncbi:hypothetical protein QC823_10800 [Halomonas vilamensis]|uniref:Uncharacterized protein n=1 Tax=Vreelandella vilamensis TaxID=531309 RepID=A0ABU1H6V1_9GAMM|nr:hypothetical protein [Halomonas vilamensis]MDR5899477.1 hypothetical protein [Halomonas vilamensis]